MSDAGGAVRDRRPRIRDTVAFGNRAESDATRTDRFEAVEGSPACLLGDFNVSGLAARHDEPRPNP